MKQDPEVFCHNDVNRYPFYSPRFWSGMRFGSYARMLSDYRFRINVQRLPMTFLVGGCTMVNTALAQIQKLVYGKRIHDTEVPPPVFVVGHWRSGTTMLHELLSLDDRFCYPTTLQCFVPHHFLVSQWMLRPIIRRLLPRKRPMDDMPAGPDLPQEDEFALVSMGAPTTYYHFAFCNEEPLGLEMLNLESADPRQVEQFRDALVYFYKTISYENDKRMVLKSPPHTGRIGHLAKWFPDAKFIHITRHPYKIFPSTMHMWKSLEQVQGFQLPSDSDRQLSGYVMDCYERMYDGYFSQVDAIPPQNLVEVRFEQLVENPNNELWRIYDAFGWDGFEAVQPKIEDYMTSRKGHQPNKTVLSDSIKKEIDQRWSAYMDRYGYSLVTA